MEGVHRDMLAFVHLDNTLLCTGLTFFSVMGLILGTAVGGVWYTWARGQYAKMDVFNNALAESQGK